MLRWLHNNNKRTNTKQQTRNSFGHLRSLRIRICDIICLNESANTRNVYPLLHTKICKHLSNDSLYMNACILAAFLAEYIHYISRFKKIHFQIKFNYQ